MNPRSNWVPIRIGLVHGLVEKAEEECFVLLMRSASQDERFFFSCFNVRGYLEKIDCCYTDDLSYNESEEPEDNHVMKVTVDSVVESFKSNSEPLIIDTNPIYIEHDWTLQWMYSECCHGGGVLLSPGGRYDGLSTEPLGCSNLE